MRDLEVHAEDKILHTDGSSTFDELLTVFTFIVCCSNTLGSHTCTIKQCPVVAQCISKMWS